MRVALIGVGVMGSAIARRLLDTEDVDLTVFNRSKPGTRPLADRGLAGRGRVQREFCDPQPQHSRYRRIGRVRRVRRR